MKVILVLGPLPAKNGKLGGVVVLFSLFLNELESRRIPYVLIDINMQNYSNRLVGMLSVIFQFFREIPNATHISFHGTASAYFYLAPIVVKVSRMLRKPVSLRKFAGDFDDIYLSLGFIKKHLVKSALSCSSFNFFETKYLVKYFNRFNDNTFWFPNVRKPTNIKNIYNKKYKKKFIFVGHVSQTKGMDEILGAAGGLDDSYCFNVVGAAVDDKYCNYEWSQHKNVQYYGQLSAQEASAMIASCDVLLLPSYREGYPGVIIEALQAGVPVIATNLKGISEIITDGIEGFLVPKADTTALINAIQKVSQDNYKELSDNAYKRGLDFSSEEVMNRYLLTIGMNEYV